MNTITGTAAGVPFTALPPSSGDSAAPVLVAWHMLDAPRSDAAFAAALPMSDVEAWRIYLGMPLCGARMVEGGMAAGIELMRRDSLRSYTNMIVRSAADEFPAALASVRAQLSIDDGPIGILGGSLGGAVALLTLARAEVPVRAAALVNPAIRARSVVALVERLFRSSYPWDREAHEIADHLDFVARADEIVDRTALLVVSGELDYPPFRIYAAALVAAARGRGADAELITVAGLAHPLAEEPGIEPAPQLPIAKTVDDILTTWFATHLAK
ncbi:prolyl oligopeptidase family serine peptidase [Nocardia sp. SYP-A9097]|uniref:prolyl oligopeptidase family serine peptidase n=1 Tax=Nocardia sp. SYP-A9097 TaxID=2663237 RepID=UPI00129ABB80|nr:prolyl oligopeptidase family serine peptidase [Nocardia sp. SYP-A9097]MRH91323.1 prolyl oligopeptidase family serine peptidase [Nocardia sp. SYP-A9097]